MGIFLSGDAACRNFSRDSESWREEFPGARIPEAEAPAAKRPALVTEMNLLRPMPESACAGFFIRNFSRPREKARNESTARVYDEGERNGQKMWSEMQK
jgi:hypothetical protein